MRRTNANIPSSSSHVRLLLRNGDLFPEVSTFLLEETSRTTTPTKARNNAKKNNSRDNNNNNTTTTSRQFLFLIYSAFVCRSFVLLQSSLCCLHQRATPSRSIFSLVSTFRRTLNERHKIAQHTTHQSAFRRTTQTSLSLSLCVCSFSNNNR